MSPKYKLTYFGLKGLGEPIRFMLSYMGEDFEDNRIDREQWPAIKPTTLWGKVPMLEVEGKTLAQSTAILRFLGKRAGLAGSDEWENANIDIIADTLTDMRLPISAFLFESNEEVKKTKKDTYLNETLPYYMQKFEAACKENGGYLANKKLSWADIQFASMCEFLSYASEKADVTADYPSLHALRQKVIALPGIAKWIAKRPNTPF